MVIFVSNRIDESELKRNDMDNYAKMVYTYRKAV